MYISKQSGTEGGGGRAQIPCLQKSGLGFRKGSVGCGPRIHVKRRLSAPPDADARTLAFGGLELGGKVTSAFLW